MADGYASRSVIISRASEPFAGVRTKTVNLNGDPIDVTNDDNDGWRTLLDVVAVQGVTISVEGVVKNDTLRAAYFTGQFIEEMEITWPDGGEMTGDFFAANYSENGSNDGELTFSCEFQSTGPVTYVSAVS